MPHPHEMVWTIEKSELFWSYLAGNHGQVDSYFGRQSGRAVIEAVRARIPLKGRVVDYGCGPGFFMEHLFAEGIACEGLDMSAQSLQSLRERLGRHHLFRGGTQIDGFPTAVQTGSVDVLFLLETIEHLLPEDMEATLAELARIIKPMGYIVITTPHAEDLERNRVLCPECGSIFHRWQHVGSFTSSKLAGLMERHGFRKLLCRPTLFSSDRKLARHVMIVGLWLFRRPLPNLLYIGRRAPDPKGR